MLGASIVGTGVHASGLYVGMTRARVQNEAIAIARTQDAAVTTIADSMMRGVPEMSVEDSRQAVLVKLRRAARVDDTAERDGSRPYAAPGSDRNVDALR